MSHIKLYKVNLDILFHSPLECSPAELTRLKPLHLQYPHRQLSTIRQPSKNLYHTVSQHIRWMYRQYMAMLYPINHRIVYSHGCITDGMHLYKIIQICSEMTEISAHLWKHRLYKDLLISHSFLNQIRRSWAHFKAIQNVPWIEALLSTLCFQI